MTDERKQDVGPTGRTRKALWWRILFGRENWYRDFWNVITTVVVAVALINADNAIDQQKAGRKAAVQVTCGALSAVIEAGRATITGSGEIQPPEFAKALERLGYPPKKVRRAAAEEAADQYRRLIASTIEKQAHVKDIVREDGTLDCSKLRALARAQ